MLKQTAQTAFEELYLPFGNFGFDKRKFCFGDVVHFSQKNANLFGKKLGEHLLVERK